MSPVLDDSKLLKLLEAGLGANEAARQLEVPNAAIEKRILSYLESGVLLVNGSNETVDWKAFGDWSRSQEPMPG